MMKMMIWEKKLKSLEKIRKERRRIHKENIYRENKKLPLLRNNKINNVTRILNSQNLNKNSTFPQIRNASLHNQFMAKFKFIIIHLCKDNWLCQQNRNLCIFNLKNLLI